jgi:hypothetical protein
MSEEAATTEKPSSKMSIIRGILDENATASPTDIQKILKDKYGMDCSTAMISNYKSQILSKKRSPKKKGEKPAPQALKNRLPKASTNGVHRPKKLVIVDENGIMVDDLMAAKMLKDKFGKDVFVKLVDVFC